jgi:ribosomal-protein-alanine N-acetyltransferase
LAGEAHIVSVCVSTKYRGQGVGELLLLACIEHATTHEASTVTLEVRASNHVAQNLYRKYGFTERGLRKAYYSDDREDAIIMTTEQILSPSFRERFLELAQSHEAVWGETKRVLD